MKPNLIQYEVLNEVLMWAVKNGLDIQVLYPDYSLPNSYQSIINQYEHIEIRSLSSSQNSDIWVAQDIAEINSFERISAPIVLRISISDFLTQYKDITDLLHKVSRLNVVFTDVPTFSDDMECEYEKALSYAANVLVNLYLCNIPSQFNLITDRTMLTKMNNCNAGVDAIAVCPDGNFYVCPAFYLSNHKHCGNIRVGINIPNKQLYSINYSPICRQCDAFHCRRCVILNKQLTYEINTPGHQQCLMAHIERRVAKKFLEEIRKYGEYASNVSIPALDYNDPFFKIIKQPR